MATNAAANNEIVALSARAPLDHGDDRCRPSHHERLERRCSVFTPR
jgi:hypothetical protein